MSKITDAMALVDAGVPDMCYELNALRRENAELRRDKTRPVVKSEFGVIGCFADVINNQADRISALEVYLGEALDAMEAKGMYVTKGRILLAAKE